LFRKEKRKKYSPIYFSYNGLNSGDLKLGSIHLHVPFLKQHARERIRD
jgi:hypothetical protein